MKRVIIVFFVALLFCNEEEIYTFVNNINEGHTVKYNKDDIMTFEMPGAGEVKLGGNKTQLLEYLGKQGELILIRSTLSNIISSNVSTILTSCGFALYKESRNLSYSF